MQDLNIDLTQWHTYRIQWRADYIGIYIDDMNNPIAEVTSPSSIPNESLRFTVWTDNYLITGSPISGASFDYLEVPDITQYIDVDYIKIYRP